MAKKRFVQVPLWWAEAAAKATTGGRAALVWIYLLHIRGRLRAQRSLFQMAIWSAAE